jgi:glycosyltransferase involved in cell wall biosynthesis
MKKKIYLFTDTFPYGSSETFLANELPFTAMAFDKVVIIPLHGKGEIRDMPSNVELWESLLSFSPKKKLSLLIKGKFNITPIFWALPEFFNKKVFLSLTRCWLFFTSLLLTRAILANRSFRQKLYANIEPEDILYFYWSDKSALLLPFLRKRLNNKTIVRFHGSDLYEEVKGYIPFRNFLFPSIDVAITVSEHGKLYLQQRYPKALLRTIEVSRLGTLHHGLNPYKKTDIFHIVTCSNLIPLKRVELLIEALALLNMPLKWTHIGHGPLMTELKVKVATLSPKVAVCFKGKLSNVEVMAFYKTTPVNVFVNVSSSEGVPVSIMEALSFGIPVLATNVGGTSEIVDNAVGVLLPSTLTKKELATQIQNIKNLTDSEYKLLRKNARIRWEKCCNAEKTYKELVNKINDYFS